MAVQWCSLCAGLHEAPGACPVDRPVGKPNTNPTGSCCPHCAEHTDRMRRVLTLLMEMVETGDTITGSRSPERG